MMDYSQALEKLKTNGQEHVLKYYDELSDTEKEALLRPDSPDGWL